MIATRPVRPAAGHRRTAARSTPTSVPKLVSALVLALLTALAAGCGGGERSGGGRGSEQAAEVEAHPAAPGGDSSGEAASESGNRARPALQQRAIIRTGTIAVITDHPRRAADRAEDLVAGTEGYVGERTTEGGDSPGEETTVRLTLRVPVDRFDAARKAISDMGKVTEDRHKSKDVTDEMVDVESRIHNQERSIARLRKLMSEADNIDEVIRIESELQSREADLESLQARQQTLAEQTSLSTLHVSLTEPDRDVPDRDEETPLGFFTGLRNGTDALLATGTVVLTVFGALAPFLAVLLVIGAPAGWLFLRWRRHRDASAPAPDPAPQPES